MKLFVLGATGGVGQQLVAEAVRRGHHVLAVARRPVGVDCVDEVIADSPSAQNALERLAGCDAVISCLGLRRRNPRNPFSALTSPPDLVASTLAHVLPAMKHANIARIIVVSAAGVGDSRSKTNAPFRAMIALSNIGKGYDDLENAERILRESDRDWLAVRPVTLTDAPSKGNAIVVDHYGLTASITRADVARFMLDRAQDAGPFTSRTPMIANAN